MQAGTPAPPPCPEAAGAPGMRDGEPPPRNGLRSRNRSPTRSPIPNPIRNRPELSPARHPAGRTRNRQDPVPPERGSAGLPRTGIPEALSALSALSVPEVLGVPASLPDGWVPAATRIGIRKATGSRTPPARAVGRRPRPADRTRAGPWAADPATGASQGSRPEPAAALRNRVWVWKGDAADERCGRGSSDGAKARSPRWGIRRGYQFQNSCRRSWLSECWLAVANAPATGSVGQRNVIC